MNNDDLREHLQGILGPGGSLGGLEGMSADDERSGLREAAQDSQELDDALRGLERIREDRELTDDEAFALEAIILPRERPVIDVLFDDFHAPPRPWGHLAMDPYKSAIKRAILAVGRVEIPNHPSKPYGGTAFVVGDGLLMTNRHVAETFAAGVGIEQLAFIPGRDPGIDFKQEVRPSDPEILDFHSVVLVHPWWDCALIRVVGLSPERAPLELASRAPDDWEDSDVVILGYPAKDHRNDIKLQDRIFNSIYERKRMQPGKARTIAPIGSYGHVVEALTHDASTLGGNSGSLVLDPATGLVLGLHFGGLYKKANYAVPAWELARDGRVQDQNVRFRDPPPAPHPNPWEEVWVAADPPAVAVEGAGEGAAPPPHGGGGAVAVGDGDAETDFQWFERNDDAAIRAALDRDHVATRRRLVAVLGAAEADGMIADLTPDATEGWFSPDVDPDLPEIVYLHGIMGSHLENALGFGLREWFSLPAFARGNVAEKLTLRRDGYNDAYPDLRLGADGHLKLKYGKATRKWRRRGFAVHQFAFDWRKPIGSSSDQLHTFLEGRAAAHPDRTFALVAHSMGGLVASLYAHRHPEWQARIQRAVFVGSPLGGSYAPLEAVLGVYPFFKTLAKLSRNDDIPDLARLAPTLPGLMQMLPNPGLFASDPDYYSAGVWHMNAPHQEWLDLSRETKDAILGSPLLERTSGIVSRRFGTVASAYVEDGRLAAGPRDVVGDGTVPLRGAAVAQLGQLYEATGKERHADLLNNADVISAAADLVTSGSTTALDSVGIADLDFDAVVVEPEAPEPGDEALEAIRQRFETGRLTADDVDWIFEPLGGPPPQ